MDVAEPSLPSRNELIEATMSALVSLGGSASVDELVAEIVLQLGLPSVVTEIPHGGRPGQTELEYRAAWARTYLKLVGLVENSERGVWSLTPEGHSTEEIDGQAIAREVSQLRHSRASVPDPATLETADTDKLDEQESGMSWQDQLLAVLRQMDPIAFERLCQRVLRESGFIEVEVTKRSGDGGIDGRGIIRLSGLVSFTVLFQSKRYAGNIGPDVVRDFRGAMVGRADKGLVMTTGGFTLEARREATRDGAPPIDLIDGMLLAEKLRELKLGVVTRIVEQIEINEAWFSSI